MEQFSLALKPMLLYIPFGSSNLASFTTLGFTHILIIIPTLTYTSQGHSFYVI